MPPLRTIGHWITTIFATVLGLLEQQRKRVQPSYAAQQESEKRLQAMFDQAAVGVALVNMETGCFERINQRYCDILGYTQDELLGQDVRNFSNTDDYQSNLALRSQLQSGKVSSFHMEKRQRRKDGTTVWIDLTVAPVLEEEGGTARYNMGVIQDITERRQMQDTLRLSEHRLRSILDHLPVGILLLEQGEQIVFRNHSFTHITGYIERELSDASTWWHRAFPDIQARNRAQAHWQLLREQAREQGGLMPRNEYEICCADGTFRSVAVSGVLLDEDEIVVFEDLSQHKADAERINYLADYDPLTGLANRRLLLDCLNTALIKSTQNEQCGGLLMLDLDRFKTLNETRGHECGDKLLCQIAQRLNEFISADDTLARHGDDSFVLVLSASGKTLSHAAAHASEVGKRILSVLRIPFVLDGEPYRTTASIGGAVFQGQEESAEELLQQVDMALYQAKAAGRDTLLLYDPHMQASVKLRAALESDLHIALEQHQFVPHYQAQIRDGHIIGAEVLVRWHHPHRGLISPAHFIPLAEETGLILPLGTYVLEAACRQLAAWATDPRLSALVLSVNISPLQFYQDDFVDHVLHILAETGANPYRLEFELTEGLLLQDVEGTTTKMARLKEQGISFALDDFGTGYSSLSYLKRLPLDELKIDQSFVSGVLVDPNDAAIVRTVLALGTALGLSVIAEGVETEEQRAFLQDHGCMTWQGYLFSKPVPVEEFEDLVGLSQQDSGRAKTGRFERA